MLSTLVFTQSCEHWCSYCADIGRGGEDLIHSYNLFGLCGHVTSLGNTLRVFHGKPVCQLVAFNLNSEHNSPVPCKQVRVSFTALACLQHWHWLATLARQSVAISCRRPKLVARSGTTLLYLPSNTAFNLECPWDVCVSSRCIHKIGHSMQDMTNQLL